MKYNFIIPYRNRKEHLGEFVRRFSSYLQDNDVDAQFYIVHQINPGEFNRGALCNIGFLEFLKIRPDGLFIFHDVDTYPTYWGSIQYDTQHGVVRHAVGQQHENLGGICCFWKKEFEQVNGFPNYWGWGIEDVTLRYRVQRNKIPIDETNIVPFDDAARCYLPKHQRNTKESVTAERNARLHKQEQQTNDRSNGLSHLQYTVLSRFELAPRFTILNVDFRITNEPK